VVVVLEFLLQPAGTVVTAFFQQLLLQPEVEAEEVAQSLNQLRRSVLVLLAAAAVVAAVLVQTVQVLERVVLGRLVKDLPVELLEHHQQQTSELVAVVVEHRQSEAMLLEMLQETAVMELHLVLPDHLLLMLEAAGAALGTIRMVVGIPLEREVPEVVDSVVV
jgi:hypothetical protein